MLDIKMIDALYAKLDRATQQQLIGELFKKSRQTMNYFKRTRDVGLTKVEILSAYFGVPIDTLVLDSKYRATTVAGNSGVRIAGVQVGDGLQKDVDHLTQLLHDAKASKSQADMQIAELRKDKADLRNEKEDLRNEKEELRNEKKELRAIIHAKDELLAAKEQEIASLKARLATLASA